MSELYGFKKNLEKVQVRSKAESAAKSHIVPTLIDVTPLAAPTTRYDFADRTIPELANWNVVVLWCRCGNANHNIICFRGVNTQNYLIDALTSTVTRGGYYVDWANNRIRVRWVDGRADLAQNFVQIMGVYGLVQNVDVVDTDTEDEPSGDDGEDIDISTLTEEVQGIRIGADGTIYETAGEAVRAQYEKLAEQLDTMGIEDTIQQIDEIIAGIPDQITDWLDEHPEATTTVQDGAITEAKLADDSITAIKLKKDHFNPVNVLSLGVKNDGTEDCSEIVNQYTADYPLYFPCGIYRVDSPITLKHSIYGAGYSRKNVVDDGFTWFVSNINNSNQSVAVFTVGDTENTNIENINIMLNSAENGINLYDTRQYTHITKVNISNVRGYGIYGYNPSDRSLSSRGLFADTLSIFGSSDYPSVSIGVYLNNNIGDCRFTNIEIMGAKCGFDLNNRISYMTNVHVWCGCMAGSDTADWWKNTIGIYCHNGSRLYATNVYLDTCYMALYATGNGSDIHVNNLIYAEDTSVSGSNAYDGTLIFTDARENRVVINGGVVAFRGDESSPSHMARLFNRANINVKLDNVTIVSNYPITIANAGKYITNRSASSAPIKYTLYNVNSTSNDVYVEVAKIPCASSSRGVIEILVGVDYGDRAKISIQKLGSNATRYSIERLSLAHFDFYYRYDATNGIVIFMKMPQTTSAAAYYITVECMMSTYNYSIVDYSNIRLRSQTNGNNEVIREVLTSADGLTKIT